MRRSLRWMLVPCLLVTTACTADGPLVPQPSPEPARLQLNAETPATARELPNWLSCAPTVLNRGEPLYVVDGVIVPAGCIGFLDPNSIEHITVSKGDPKFNGTRAVRDVVFITTRVQR